MSADRAWELVGAAAVSAVVGFLTALVLVSGTRNQVEVNTGRINTLEGQVDVMQRDLAELRGELKGIDKEHGVLETLMNGVTIVPRKPVSR